MVSKETFGGGKDSRVLKSPLKYSKEECRLESLFHTACFYQRYLGLKNAASRVFTPVEIFS